MTCIEVLIPRNKISGHPGRELYMKKQDELLGSRTHLIEIDLLRQGPHTVAAPEPLLAEHGPWHYVVSLHRGGEGERYETWPVELRQRLPRYCVPVEGADAVTLDLQRLFTECYEEGAFDRQVDYRKEPPPPPLLRADRAWLAETLANAGLR